jgi:putative NADH-flavin reductase
VEQAVALGHEVTALVRSAERLGPLASRVRVIEGSINDHQPIDEAVAGADAVISALGPDSNSVEQVDLLRSAMLATLEAMKRHRVRRIVNLSGAGISVPGERKPVLDRIASRLVRRFARNIVAAKQAEYDALAASDEIEWVAVRPGLVTDGELTARYVAGPDALRPGARISRADVAHLMLRQAEAPTHVGPPGVFVRSS